jgi:hypothetical protein
MTGLWCDPNIDYLCHSRRFEPGKFTFSNGKSASVYRWREVNLKLSNCGSGGELRDDVELLEFESKRQDLFSRRR